MRPTKLPYLRFRFLRLLCVLARRFWTISLAVNVLSRFLAEILVCCRWLGFLLIPDRCADISYGPRVIRVTRSCHLNKKINSF